MLAAQLRAVNALSLPYCEPMKGRKEADNVIGEWKNCWSRQKCTS